MSLGAELTILTQITIESWMEVNEHSDRGRNEDQYNFVRHQTLEGMTPAKSAGIGGNDNWSELLAKALEK